MAPLTHRLREAGAQYARRLPFVTHLWARYRSRRYEQRIAGFLRDKDGRAGRLPLGVVYEATMRCNLHCEFCYVGTLLNIEGEWREELPIDVLRRAFPEQEGLQVSLTGGEIFMRKDILTVMEVFREKGYVCGYLTTNGTIISEERADALAALAAAGFLKHISVSIDGPGEMHDKARGVKGTFVRTSEGLRRLQAAARRLHAPLRVSVNTTVAHETLDALSDMVDVADELGVDAIGLNHLMFSTPAEVAETVRLVGAPDASVDLDVRHRRPRPEPRAGATGGGPARCPLPRERGALRHAPEGPWGPGAAVLHTRIGHRGPVSLSVSLREDLVQRQSVLLPVHPGRSGRPHDRDARGDLDGRAVRFVAANARREWYLSGLQALLQSRTPTARNRWDPAGRGAPRGSHRYLTGPRCSVRRHCS